MSAWLIGMSAGSVLLYALYGLRCARAERIPVLRRRPWLTSLLSLAFSVLFGAVLARIGYVLLIEVPALDFEYEGLAALEELDLLDFELDQVSFFCGAVGVCLGVLLANRLTRKGAAFAGMDAFAPFGALLAALFRLGELLLKNVGLASYYAGNSLSEDSPLAFFPFAVEITTDSGTSYWAWAVCVLSAVFALAWAAIAFFRLRGKGRTGLVFSLTLFFLALPQLLCESLRNRGMYWEPFVHVEQVLCGVVLLAVLFFWALKTGRGVPALRRWLPFLATVLCFGLIIVVEFIIGGKIIDLSRPVSYLVMLVPLAAIVLLGIAAARRWDAAKQGD